MVAVVPTAMVAAGVATLAVVVVIAVYIRVIGQGAVQQADTGLSQCHLGTAADSSANQGVNTALHQKTGQCTVTAAVGVNNLCAGCCRY